MGGQPWWDQAAPLGQEEHHCKPEDDCLGFPKAAVEELGFVLGSAQYAEVVEAEFQCLAD